MKKERIILSIIITGMVILFSLIFINIGHITSDSMEPTLPEGSIVLINRLSYVAASPQRGDVVAIKKNNEFLIKRIVGINGDVIECSNGTIILNNNVLNEPYIEKNIETNFYEIYNVPENSYFLLGDNRETSYDARFWGESYITKDMIIGRVIYCIDDSGIRNINQFQTVFE